MENKDLAVANQISGLSTKITPAMLEEMTDQRKQLERFVQTQLLDGTDYGTIPGVKGKSLFKPGAEKMASIYQLGSRIIKTDRVIDIEKNFAMFEITVEVFHVPSGKAIAQCSAVTNSQEKKWKERQNYKWINNVKTPDGPPVPTPVGDILNTLSKMAQKRAFVGAVIMATKASDFLTHDLAEEEEDYNDENPGWREKQQAVQAEQLAKAKAANNAAQSQRKATAGATFDDFAGGGFKVPPKEEPVLDPEMERKKAYLREVAVERVRLQWTPPAMASYVQNNFGKEPNLLTSDELEMLVTALKREKKK